MRIGIVAERVGTQSGGVEIYERGLIRGLMSLNEIHDYRIFCASRRGWGKLWNGHSRFTFTTVWEQSVWLRFILGLPLALRQARPEVVHYCLAPPLFLTGPTILTVHDLAPFTHPKFLPTLLTLRLRFLVAKGIKAAQRIIAVSRLTREAVVQYFGVDPRKIAVIPLGIDAHFRPDKPADLKEVLRGYGITGPYILFLGRIEPRKNLKGMMQAFHLLKQRRKVPHKLVVVGKVFSWGEEDVAHCEKLGLQDDVRFLGYVPRAHIPHLYHGATVFAFPSLFEGFGLPPLEAMACGTPVVASHIPALAEVLGEAAAWVDPRDAAGLAHSIEELLGPGERRRQLIARGLEQAARFTWQETARQTLAVYRQVAGGNG